MGQKTAEGHLTCETGEYVYDPILSNNVRYAQLIRSCLLALAARPWHHDAWNIHGNDGLLLL